MGAWAAGEYHPRPGSRRLDGRRAALLSALSLLVAGLVALTALLLTGVVRLGRPSVSSVATAPRVDRAARPVETAARFSAEAPRIYCTAKVRAFDDTVVEARWLKGGELIRSFARPFSGLTGAPAGRLLPSTANVAFYIDRPQGGWAPGAYSVEVRLDGRRAGGTQFTVAGAGVSGEDTGATVFRAGDGSFSVTYPPGWSEAEPESLGDALAGFISPETGGYPARFVVLLSDYESAEPEYLNGLLETEGDQGFTAYSLGDRRGARRTFNWIFDSSGGPLELRTVQVVMPGEDGVYVLNCHSLAAEFEDSAETFNSIINSFRVR